MPSQELRRDYDGVSEQLRERSAEGIAAAQSASEEAALGQMETAQAAAAALESANSNLAAQAAVAAARAEASRVEAEELRQHLHDLESALHTSQVRCGGCSSPAGAAWLGGSHSCHSGPELSTDAETTFHHIKHDLDRPRGRILEADTFQHCAAGCTSGEQFP